MKDRGLKTVLLAGIVVAASALAASDNYRVVGQNAPTYYGHISLADIKNDGKDPVVIRDGKETPEIANLNFPLAPGDAVRTSDERRCEIQLDNATIIRLDVGTELKIETLLAQSLSSPMKISNLVLRRGRIFIMYKEYNEKEVFQVVTANSAVKLKHNSVASIGFKNDGGTEVRVDHGQASVLFGPDIGHLRREDIGKNERITILINHLFVFGQFGGSPDFESWNAAVNKDFLDLHKGKSALPKPVQKLPPAVFYFAQTFGNLYGEWLYDDLYGYIWRPFTNDYYPGGSWRPYFYGRWTSSAGRMFWIPDEPWGWVPYHLGVWQWDEKRGWFWLPGSAFAPAWVDWAFFGGSYYAWRPWSMWDWMWYGGDFDFWGYDEFGFFGWYGDSWNYDDPGNMPGGRSINVAKNRVSVNQLRRPANPRLLMPREFQKLSKSLLAAVKRGDARALDALRNVSKQAVIVRASDINAPKIPDKALTRESILAAVRNMSGPAPLTAISRLPALSSLNSAKIAARSFDRNTRAASPRASGGAMPKPEMLDKSLVSLQQLPAAIRSYLMSPPTRIRDWNPDVKEARRIGVDLLYLSGSNTIFSPQLKLSSLDALGGKIMRSSSPTGVYELRRGEGSGGSTSSSESSSGAGSSSASSGSSAGASSGASTSSGSSASSGGGHIR
jgi:hypothetical protein